MARDTVLVVEDDRLLLDLLTEVLAAGGYRVVAADAAGCLAAACRERPGLVILDVWPDHAGAVQATQGLRDSPDTAHIRIVALAEESLRVGVLADEWLPKPFRVADLDAAVTRWLPPEGDTPPE